MSGADGYTQPIEQHAEVIGMNVPYKEREYTALMFGFSDDTGIGESSHAFGGHSQEFVFMCGYGFQAQSLDVVESCGQSREPT